MFGANRGKCALGLVWLVLMGCVGTDQFNLQYMQSTFWGGDRVVAASVESVSESTQAGLTRLGMKVVSIPQGQDVRLTGVTRGGKRFALVLKRQKADSVERTAIAVEWEKEADDQFWAAVVDLLAITARN